MTSPTPIPDGSTWYRTGKIIKRSFATADYDGSVGDSIATHAILTGLGTMWTSVVFPGDILQFKGSGRLFEVTKIIDDTRLKIRILLADVSSIPNLGTGIEYNVVPMGQRSSSNISSQLAALLNRLQKRDVEMTDWASGKANGGILGDGKYPITTVDGTQRYIPCPAAIGAEMSKYIPVAGADVIDAKPWNGARRVYLKTISYSETDSNGELTVVLPIAKRHNVIHIALPFNAKVCRIIIPNDLALEENSIWYPKDLSDQSLTDPQITAYTEINVRLIISTDRENGSKIIWPEESVASKSIMWNFGYIPTLALGSAQAAAQVSKHRSMIVDLIFYAGAGESRVFGNYYGRNV